MSDFRDDEHLVDELFARLNPVDEAELPLPSESLSAQALIGHITGTHRSARTLKRRRRYRWLIPAVAAVLAVGFGAGSAYGGLFASKVTQRLVVLCYSTSNMSGKAVAVAATDQGPIASCQGAWNQGHVGSGPTPLLVACVTHQGVAAVFPSPPGASVCAQLGLPPLAAGATSPNATTTTAPSTTLPSGAMPLALRNAIVSQMQAQCLSASLAKKTLDLLLANAGVHWTVTVGAFPPGRPCASPGFDETDHTVVVVGIPPLTPTS